MTTQSSFRVLAIACVLVGPARVGAAEAPPESAPASSPAAAPAPAKARTAVYLSFGGGALADVERASVTAQLTIVRPLWRWLALDIGLSNGWSPSGPLAEDYYWWRMSLGARVEPVSWALRPFVALLLTHVHMATTHTWLDHPVASASGSSEHGLGHRSGIVLAAGASWEVPKTARHLRLLATSELMALLIGSGPRYFTTFQIGAGWAL